MKLRYFLFLILLAIIFPCFTARADEGADRMILYYKDGTNLEILLSDMPEIKFADGELCLSSSSTNIKCPLENVAYYAFKVPNLSGTETVNIPEFSLIREGDIIKIVSAVEKYSIQLLDLHGFKVNADISYTDSGCIVNIANLSKGVYVLSINGHAIKIIKE